MAKGQPVAYLTFNETEAHTQGEYNNQETGVRNRLADEANYCNTRRRVLNAEWRNKMKNRIRLTCVAASALALFLFAGCDRQVSKTASSSVSSDGTVKSKEKTVTQTPEGTVTKTEESKTTAPDK